jgi:hypothetical protein
VRRVGVTAAAVVAGEMVAGWPARRDRCSVVAGLRARSSRRARRRGGCSWSSPSRRPASEFVRVRTVVAPALPARARRAARAFRCGRCSWAARSDRPHVAAGGSCSTWRRRRWDAAAGRRAASGLVRVTVAATAAAVDAR